MKKYLSVDEASRLLHVQPQTIYKWICEKRIPSIAVNGRTLFDEEELHAWIESKKRGPAVNFRQKSLGQHKSKNLSGDTL